MQGKHKGSSTVEYVLPTAIVVVLAGTALWGLRIKEPMLDFVTKTVSGKAGNGTIALAPLGTAMLPPMAAQMPPLEKGEEQLCFNDSGVCLSIPVMASLAGAGAEAETIGGLGGENTKKLAYVLKQVPEILKELNVEPVVIDKVTRVANQGHTMGEQLQTVEALCPSGQVCQGSTADQAKSTVNTLKSEELNELLTHWQELDAYLTAHPDALRKFPEARSIIQQKVKEIQEIIAGLGAEDKIEEVAVEVDVAEAQAENVTKVIAFNASQQFQKLVQFRTQVLRKTPNTLLKEYGFSGNGSRRTVCMKGACHRQDSYSEYKMVQDLVAQYEKAVQQQPALASRYQIDVSALKNMDLNTFDRLQIFSSSPYQSINRAPVVSNLNRSIRQQVVQTVQKTVQRKARETRAVNQGVVLQAGPKIREIRQDANTICGNGGDQTCFRRQYGGEWLTLERK